MSKSLKEDAFGNISTPTRPVYSDSINRFQTTDHVLAQLLGDLDDLDWRFGGGYHQSSKEIESAMGKLLAIQAWELHTSL
jgi:hypothetical protein